MKNSKKIIKFNKIIEAVLLCACMLGTTAYVRASDYRFFDDCERIHRTVYDGIHYYYDNPAHYYGTFPTRDGYVFAGFVRLNTKYYDENGVRLHTFTINNGIANFYTIWKKTAHPHTNCKYAGIMENNGSAAACYYCLDNNGTLYISPNAYKNVSCGDYGYVPNNLLSLDFGNSGADQPWKDWRSEIKNIVVEPGITKLGKDMFFGCNKVVNITLPASKDAAFEQERQKTAEKDAALAAALAKISQLEKQNK
jgi:hypothetical protein